MLSNHLNPRFNLIAEPKTLFIIHNFTKTSRLSWPGGEADVLALYQPRCPLKRNLFLILKKTKCGWASTKQSESQKAGPSVGRTIGSGQPRMILEANQFGEGDGSGSIVRPFCFSLLLLHASLYSISTRAYFHQTQSLRCASRNIFHIIF